MVKHLANSIILGLLLANVAAAQTMTLAPPGTVVPYAKSAELRLPGARGVQVRPVGAIDRMDSPDCSGSTHVLRLRVNGQVVSGAVDRSHPRLLNKPLTARMASGGVIPWVRDGAWRVVYAPDFECVAPTRPAGCGSWTYRATVWCWTSPIWSRRAPTTSCSWSIWATTCGPTSPRPIPRWTSSWTN